MKIVPLICHRGTRWLCRFVLFCTGVFSLAATQSWGELFEQLEVAIDEIIEYEDGSVGFLLSLENEKPIILQAESLTVQAEQEKIFYEFVILLRSFRLIEIGRINFYFKDDIAEMSIELSSLMSRNEELAQYIPSGMHFFEDGDGEIAYSFRMLVDTQVLGVYGLYFDEATLIRRIENAWENPEAFVRGQDPEFILTLLGRIEDKIFSIEDSLENIRSAIFRTDGGILSEIEKLSERIAVNKSTHEKGLQVHEESLQVHEESLQAHEESLQNIGTSIETLRTGAVALFHSVGILKKVVPVNQELVSWIQEYLESHPAVDFQTLLSQLKEVGFRVSKKKLRAILGVYFGDTRE